MRLNTIKVGEGARSTAKRVGRGIGSGLGKTAGRGHKGQKSRAGGFHRSGFEGGQTPLHRRLPKRGFKSLKNIYAQEITLNTLEKLDINEIDLLVLKSNNVVKESISQVKVILSGNITKPVVLKGIKATKGAKSAIEKAGGKIVDNN